MNLGSEVMKVLAHVRDLSPTFVYQTLHMRNNTIRNNKSYTEIYWKLAKEGRMFLSIREAYNIYHYLNRSIALGGAVAEFGVYKGGSAKLICSSKSELPLHLWVFRKICG